jgi:hypothetical protein
VYVRENLPALQLRQMVPGCSIPFNMPTKNTQKNAVCHVRPLLPVCLFLVISILCVYWQARNFSFVNFDDRQYVTQNYQVQAGLTAESIRWSFTATHASNWHPV